MMVRRSLSIGLRAFAFGACVLAAGQAFAAEELPVYSLVARDGTFEPTTIEVPAGKRFKIEITNAGKSPIEFESRELRQEKVLAGGAKSSVVINGLKPGTYPFFDEFHPDTGKGRVVAK
jgi:plastocyanin